MISEIVYKFALDTIYNKVNLIEKNSDYTKMLRFKKRLNINKIYPLPHLDRENSSSTMNYISDVLRGTFSLLYYTAHDPWKIHRGFPSARCLHTIESYLIVNKASQELEQGAYRFDPLRNELEVIGLGEPSYLLERAFNQDMKRVSRIWVFSSEFWRLGKEYGDFAYNLALLEAGHAIEQLYMHINTCQKSNHSQLRYVFCYQNIAKMLNIPVEEEGVLAAIIEYEDSQDVEEDGYQERKLKEYEVLHEFPNWEQSNGLRSGYCERLREMESYFLSLTTTNESFPVVHFPNLEIDLKLLRETTYQRNSGQGLFGVVGKYRPIDWQTFTQIGRFNVDIQEESVQLYAFVIQAEDFEAGIYSYSANEKEFVQKNMGQFENLLQKNCQYPFFNLHSMTCVYFIYSPIKLYVEKYGPVGWRIALMEAGRIAQRICMQYAELGFFARPVKCFDEEGMNTVLISEDRMPIYSIIVGSSKYSDLKINISD